MGQHSNEKKSQVQSLCFEIVVLSENGKVKLVP